MPETLFHKDFSGGWSPSSDPIDSPPNVLLHMNNVELDQNGALSLCGGVHTLYTGYSGYAHTMYSRYIGSLRYDYCAIGNGDAYRNTTKIFSGGDGIIAAFGTAFDFVLICSGTQRFKDNGTTLVQLGIVPPTTAPTITLPNVNNAAWSTIGAYTSSYVVPKGSVTVSSAFITCTTDTNGNFAMQSYGMPGVPFNNIWLSGVAGAGHGTDQDYVEVQGFINPDHPDVNLTFDILLVPGAASGDTVSDFYTATARVQDQETFNGITGYFSIKFRRINFTKAGGGSYDWGAVYGFRLSLDNNDGQFSDFNYIWSLYQGLNNFVWVGGEIGLFGNYQWAQVNVNNTGSYLGKSILGPASLPVNVDGVSPQIFYQAPTDPQVNEVWIFRRGGDLGQWYRVLRIVPPFTGGPVYDTLSDQKALDLDITVNLNLISIAATSIPSNVHDIIGPMQGRWFYFTDSFVYPSDINNPDLVDVSLAIRICGSNAEKLMWARNISASVLVVGTSIDCYLMTGTFTTFPDNSVDVYYQSLGVKFPPITYDAVAYGGAIYYMASDGWRMLLATSFGTTYSAQNNQLIISPHLDRLYRGETCNGYPGVNLNFSPGGSNRFPVTIGKNKIFCFIKGNQRIEVYDFLRQYWRVVKYNIGDATACTTTQDGRVLAFFWDSNTVKEIDTHPDKTIDGNPQSCDIMFPYKDDNRPRNRKDTYTFKSRCYTGGGVMNVIIIDESNKIYSVPGSIQSNSGLSEQFLDLSTIFDAAGFLPKSYQVILITAGSDLTIQDWSINYDLRPEPLTYLKINNQNYNTTARKRIYTVPFQVDTLGNPILIQPTVDGVPYTSLQVNTSRKQSVDYFFNLTSPSGYELVPVGKDYDWVINGQGKEFEFYGFQEIRNIEVFPDPCTSYIIPKSNYGSPVAKRFRTWPFLINTRGHNVTFTPYVDQVPAPPSIFNTGQERATVFHYFTTDVFGIDYGGTFFDPSGLLEIWRATGQDAMTPDSVQNLPMAHEYDQVGPVEIFRWGKILQMVLRTQSSGTPIPFRIYIADELVYSGQFDVEVGREDEYIVDLPKGVSGSVMRVELGPCGFTFSRYYIKFRVAQSGGQENTELRWITFPGITSTLAAGL